VVLPESGQRSIRLPHHPRDLSVCPEVFASWAHFIQGCVLIDKALDLVQRCGGLAALKKLVDRLEDNFGHFPRWVNDYLTATTVRGRELPEAKAILRPQR
jgi:hypothetical protein